MKMHKFANDSSCLWTLKKKNYENQPPIFIIFTGDSMMISSVYANPEHCVWGWGNKNTDCLLGCFLFFYQMLFQVRSDNSCVYLKQFFLYIIAHPTFVEKWRWKRK